MDFVLKPSKSLSGGISAIAQELIEKVKNAAQDRFPAGVASLGTPLPAPAARAPAARPRAPGVEPGRERRTKAASWWPSAPPRGGRWR